MEFYDRSARVEGSHTHLALEWNRTPAETGLEEPLWRLRIGGDGSRELYPERPGELDCPFYMRTGLCGYGGGCRFNHPGDRNLRLAVLGEYPERVGEPVCQYFLKTGTCKFGATCKFHHPKNGSRNTLPVNYLGYPLRPGAPICTFYAQHGVCKFGPTCKYDHPMGSIGYRSSDVSVASYPVGLSMAALAPSSSSSDFRAESVAGLIEDSLAVSESNRVLSTETGSGGSMGSVFSKVGQVSIASSHSTAPLSGGIVPSGDK